MNRSTTKAYKAPLGRLATVQSIQNYSRTKNIHVKDYYSPTVSRTPKYMAQKNEYGLPGGNEFPMIHKATPKLQNGKVKKVFKDDKLFEMDSKGSKKQQRRQKKSSPLVPKEKRVILDYSQEFHQI